MHHPKILAAACAAVVSLALTGVAQAQDALARAKAAATLRIATEEQFPPYDFIQDGKHAGFNVDLFDAIGQKMGLKITWIDLPWSKAQLGLQDKKFDLIAGPTAITAEREQAFRFLPPISSSQAMIEIRKGQAGMAKPADIAGKKIGAQRDSFALAELRKLSATLSQPADIVEYPDNTRANADLAAGRLDGVAVAANDAMEILKQRPAGLGVIRPGFGTKVYSGYMMRQDEDSKSLFDALSATMLKLKKEGTLAKLQTKWFGAAITVPDAAPKLAQ